MIEHDKTVKVDLRVAKTQIALCTALFLLLETTQFQKITVNDLCKTAMVSRATFYMHFEDKYHLLRYAMERLGEELLTGVDDRKEVIEKAVRFSIDKAQMLRNLLSESNQELARMFQDSVVESVAQTLRKREEEGQVFDVPIEILAAFVAGGISNILIRWIAGGFEMPPEEMADHLLMLTEHWEHC